MARAPQRSIAPGVAAAGAAKTCGRWRRRCGQVRPPQVRPSAEPPQGTDRGDIVRARTRAGGRRQSQVVCRRAGRGPQLRRVRGASRHPEPHRRARGAPSAQSLDRFLWYDRRCEEDASTLGRVHPASALAQRLGAAKVHQRKAAHAGGQSWGMGRVCPRRAEEGARKASGSWRQVPTPPPPRSPAAPPRGAVGLPPRGSRRPASPRDAGAPPGPT